VKVGFLQFQPIFGDKEKNIKKAILMAEKVEADLLVLPELCTTGYLFKNRDELESLAEKIPDGEAIKHFLNLSSKKKMNIVFGMAEKDENRIFNSSILVTPQGNINTYRKLHLFWEEKLLFTPGNKELEVFDMDGVKLGMMICFDWIFPEVARVLTLRGAEIICHPSNLMLPYAQPAMVTRSIENRVFSITCNRIGTEQKNDEKLCFTGQSQIVEPSGNILTKASEDQEEVRVLEIDPGLARNKEITPYNDLWRDRRVDFYSELMRF
jgi:predicted amidohydrolase